jgi:serine/tyrosine/threonine adenylyltransferase
LRAKLGLTARVEREHGPDLALGESWLDLLHAQQVDYTLAWRRLADAAAGDEAPLRALFPGQPGLDRWLQRWRQRCAAEDAGFAAPTDRAAVMRSVNPWLIPRNHRVEEALTAASDEGDLAPFEQLLNALGDPFVENPALARYAEPAPDGFMSGFRTFCGT